MRNVLNLLLISACVALLAACGSSSGSSDSGTTVPTAPVDQNTDGAVPAPAPQLDGQALFAGNCATCHNIGLTSTVMNLEGDGARVPGKFPGHMGIGVTTEEVAAIAAFVDGQAPAPAPAPDPAPAPAPSPLDGAALYAGECQGCHGALATTDIGSRTAAAIQDAIAADMGGMGSIILAAEEAQAIAAALPAAAPAPDPAPAPADGKTVYDGRCAGCHALGTYDASGSAPNLAGKESLIAAKLQAGHMGIAATTAEVAALAGFVAANTPAAPPEPPPASEPAPAPAPAPVDGKTAYDDNCAVCHLLGAYDASGFAPDLAGKSGMVGAKTAGGHGGGPYAADSLAALVDFIAANTPAVPAPPAAPAPPSYADCTACHGQPPAGSAFPDTAGAHAAHRALPGIGTNCAVCHQGAAHNGWVDLAFQGGLNAKTGTAVDNGDGTCSNLSCHGGQKTPAWWTGSIDVNTQCASCHAAGTTQYNSYSSGDHSRHSRYACTVCHEVGKLALNHFTSLGTTAMEGPAGATIGGGATRVTSYSQTTRSCMPSCHGSETW